MIRNFTLVEGKKHSYTIEKIDSISSEIICKSAKIKQVFLNEDLLSLLEDLPNLIKSEIQHQEKKDSIIRFRVTATEKLKLQEKIKSGGYKNLSSFIKDKVLN